MNTFRGTFRMGRLSCVVALSAFLAVPRTQAAPEDVIPAIILKVEGDGIANVRKRSGVVESAGARGKVYVGDRVITDSRSAVHLMLNDGSVLKVGFNSEFTLEKVENKRRYLSWLFKLVHGSIRALVEKIPAQETHLRIETPSGTVGVRGTEFVLVYDEGSSASSLYMLEGVVSYGASGCEASRSCQDVHGGEAATMQKGSTKPSAPAKYNVTDLLGLGRQASPGANVEARLSLFRDARRAQSKTLQGVGDAALKKIIDDASIELAAAQDRAIGRTEEQREAMHAAIKNGTYEGILAAADSYAASQGAFNPASNGGAENLVAQVAASKFRLGDAVKKADAAGLFVDKPAVPDLNMGKVSPDAAATPADTSARTYQLRKTVDYDQAAVAKTGKEALSKSLDDYKDTLDYAEALSASQVSAGDAPKDAKSSQSPSAPAAAPDEKAGAPQAAPAVPPCDAACEDSRIAHEADVASEGTVNAFQNPIAAQSSASADAVPSKRGKGGLPGSLKTQYFRRTVPGDSCFRSQSKCTMQPCAGFGKGKKCKPGETVEVCDTKRIPVRCGN